MKKKSNKIIRVQDLKKSPLRKKRKKKRKKGPSLLVSEAKLKQNLLEKAPEILDWLLKRGKQERKKKKQTNQDNGVSISSRLPPAMLMLSVQVLKMIDRADSAHHAAAAKNKDDLIALIKSGRITLKEAREVADFLGLKQGGSSSIYDDMINTARKLSKELPS